MSKKTIKEQIADFEKIKSLSKDQSEISYCEVKIARLTKELEKTNPKSNSSKKNNAEALDDLDFDFNKKSDQKIVKARKKYLNSSIKDEFAGTY
jgi:hypothetical protein